MLDRSENAVDGESQVGQEVEEQLISAVQTISDPGTEESWKHQGAECCTW